MQSILDFIWNNSTLIALALFAISEVLAQIPSVKSNSIFQLITNLLRSRAGK
jgi:hypothetical protein